MTTAGGRGTRPGAVAGLVFLAAAAAVALRVLALLTEPRLRAEEASVYLADALWALLMLAVWPERRGAA